MHFDFNVNFQSRMAYDKVDARKDRRRYQSAVEDLKSQIDRYNSGQYKWVEDMIAVAGVRDYGCFAILPPSVLLPVLVGAPPLVVAIVCVLLPESFAFV